MKKILFCVCALAFFSAGAQTTGTPTLRSILLDQLKTTHNQQEWFVPVSKAVEGLTAEQASWREDTVNHSIAQLVSHLIFWNQQELDKFNGKAPASFDGDNTKTFAPVDKAHWTLLVRQLDELLTAWEVAIAAADEAKLQKWYSIIAHISTHNAYHTGQIMYIRKRQGSWDDSKGVK
jgi:uncharacterized damage-inducible protein DinB